MMTMAKPTTAPEPDDRADTVAAAKGKKTQPADEGRPYNMGSIRLLVVDDDPAVGRLITAALAQHEFVIDVVSEPHQVEAYLRKQEYHLIILDYVLPGLATQ